MEPTIETYEFEDINLGKEIAKSFAQSAAVTAGAWAGILGLAFAFAGVTSLVEKIKARKTTTTE